VLQTAFRIHADFNREDRVPKPLYCSQEHLANKANPLRIGRDIMMNVESSGTSLNRNFAPPPLIVTEAGNFIGGFSSVYKAIGNEDGPGGLTDQGVKKPPAGGTTTTNNCQGGNCAAGCGVAAPKVK